MKVLEAHYAPAHVAALLFRSESWVIKSLKKGEFGRCVFDGQWLIPASGVNAWIDRHAIDFDNGEHAPRPDAVQVRGLKRG